MLQPPSVCPSQYLPKHYHDRKLKDREMDPNEFTEFLRHLSPLGSQWVVEWWRITSIVNHVFKDNYIPLIGLRYYSYYSPSRIARQFGDHQGIPNEDGIFHISVFTKKVLGRIRETLLKRIVAKDIHFPQFLHPTSGYKAWLIVDMRLVHIEEKDY